MPEFSGWLFTDARRLMACPRCQAQPGNPCRAPKGRKTNSPHAERVSALIAAYPEAQQHATRKSTTAEELRQRIPPGTPVVIVGLFDNP